eukprot:CAMPEP_0170789300 /NCGR_PEP_ID=MMETSP0733-20121128/19609_1 /TAXON_ID=186038 /ORGANISM="Fragilariopsis kerguelensis, Strain L26-C5" /LENGTH=112 /DNA_ID=CAMNT_0011136297 /DNA_START=226 /DNA_END=565 /DNA_ORIENTATION=-
MIIILVGRFIITVGVGIHIVFVDWEIRILVSSSENIQIKLFGKRCCESDNPGKTGERVPGAGTATTATAAEAEAKLVGMYDTDVPGGKDEMDTVLAGGTSIDDVVVAVAVDI